RPTRRLRVPVERSRPVGGEEHTTAVDAPERQQIFCRSVRQPFEPPAFEIPDPNVSIGARNIERNTCSVWRDPWVLIAAGRQAERLLVPVMIHPGERGQILVGLARSQKHEGSGLRYGELRGAVVGGSCERDIGERGDVSTNSL